MNSAALPERWTPSDRVRHQHSATVLVVEDDTIIRALCGRILEGGGYSVLQAADAAAALELVQHGSAAPDLLLSDLLMPGMHGRELSQHLREQLPELAVAYMSGCSDDVLADGPLAGSKAYFLQKPFPAESLLATVAEALAGRAST